MVPGDAARLRELHVGDARAALEPEDRRARMGRARLDARDRQRDQPGVRVVPGSPGRRASRSRRRSCPAPCRSGTDAGSAGRPSPRRGRRPRCRRRRGRRYASPSASTATSTSPVIRAAPIEHACGLRARLRPAPAAGSGSSTISSSPWSKCGSHSSHDGRYQFRSPSSFIDAGQQHAADDRRVDQDRRGEPDAELLEEEQRQRREDREHADHHDRRAGDDARRRADAVRDRLVHRGAPLEPLADPADDEHVVVHREAEQDHEQEQRDDRRDAGGRTEAEEALADTRAGRPARGSRTPPRRTGS